jgi:hypothetical protein
MVKISMRKGRGSQDIAFDDSSRGIDWLTDKANNNDRKNKDSSHHESFHAVSGRKQLSATSIQKKIVTATR